MTTAQDQSLEKPAELKKGNVAKSGRDWLALTVSLVSLLVSGLTVYFNVVLRQDDIRIVVDRMPDMSRDQKGVMFASNGIQLTVLNVGNRSAVVTKLLAVAYQRDAENSSRECKNPSDNAPFPIAFLNDFKPIVVKPGEIQFVSSRVQPVFPWNTVKRDDLGEVAFPKEMHGNNVQFFLMCLELTVTTPDSPAYRWSAPISLMKKEPVTADYLPTELQDKDKPVTVLRARHTVFQF